MFAPPTGLAQSSLSSGPHAHEGHVDAGGRNPTEMSTTPSGTPHLEPTSLEAAGAFVTQAGLIVEEVSPTHVVGHIELSSDHHTPWGIVHGGVYSTAIESSVSIGASAAVRHRNQVAVGLTNTTHFLRSLSAGRVKVEADALYQGRTHQLWRADITDESGRLVAHGEVRLQNIEARPLESTGG
jgi:1,4-dihydroxy-2-naphthoyl-CoA hydrolase